MDLELTEDEVAFADAFARVLTSARAVPTGDTSAWLGDETLEQALQSNGFFDPELARDVPAVAILAAIEAAAALPLSLEIANSLFIAPRVAAADLARPIAVAGPGVTGPIRHLGVARTLIAEHDGAVRALDLSACSVAPVPTIFAYPFARLEQVDWSRAERLDVTPEEFARLRRVAVAAELVGIMQGALDLTVGYVQQRVQFKRPIGSFQVVRHRLGECLTMVMGARQLAHRAGWSGDPADAALALSFAQGAAARCVYETQQFHGAIGQTLEYPLHLWTYRLRALQGELGGNATNATDAAKNIWGDGHEG